MALVGNRRRIGGDPEEGHPSIPGWHLILLRLPLDFGINLFGQLSSATGLGMTARHTAKALLAAGVPFVCSDIRAYYPTSDVGEELAEFSGHFARSPTDLCFPVNLYCVPVGDIPVIVQQVAQASAPPRFLAAVVWWETTQLHKDWAQTLIRLDALVAYSEFLSGVLSNLLPLTPVVTGQQPLFLPDGIGANRTTFGLPNDATVFVSSFDPSSDPARKNPAAILEAFRQAFPGDGGNVRMVFRLNNAYSTEMARETTRLLQEAAAGDHRIGFATEPMSYRQVLSLYASADVFVSLHRAEGLGLGLLESMRLGVPVIATGWSGNMTFMDHSCAAIVRYGLAPISGSHPVFSAKALGPDAIWAEPVIEDAVAWMRHLHSQPEDRRRLGAAARLRSESYQQEALDLGWLQQLTDIRTAATVLPRVHGKLSGMSG
ncbi:MAG: glycosyltransferase [Sulfuritalea sp.]|nr:glycosyltransferase [Sulfuritalea sp.]